MSNLHPAFSFVEKIATLHRVTDPDTSREAAASVVPHLNELQQRVLDYALSRDKYGFTDCHMSFHLGAENKSTFRTRRRELTVMGLIKDTGRTTLIGSRRHTVWVHRDFAHDAE